MNIYVINAEASIKQALILIDKNNEGLVCISDDTNKVIGLATDGI